ncbi:MAG TPA: peptide-methionine (R)-S-oxide reductase [Myxococcota bacterium]|nr:peptide-methionine (R)-S-oxide reductase [Myxococcota bacterium]
MRRLIPVLAVAVLAVTVLTGCEMDPDVQGAVPCEPLTAEEEAVIAFKATEPRFTGEYVETHDDGVYHCRRCGRPLYESEYKFNSGSGWPAFDRAIEGAVTETPDADGFRTEITCTYCGGHLGHVFRGEGFTETSTRHCVNSISLKFLPDDPGAAEANREFLETRCQFAYFAGGDFRALEYCTQLEPGVITAYSGFMGGSADNPSFAEVQVGDTGHAQTVRVEFDQSMTDYMTLARRFMKLHDPTVELIDPPLGGSQFRSIMFVVNEDQRQQATALLAEMADDAPPISTGINDAGHFWLAPNTYQDFYSDLPVKPACAE